MLASVAALEAEAVRLDVDAWIAAVHETSHALPLLIRGGMRFETLSIGIEQRGGQLWGDGGGAIVGAQHDRISWQLEYLAGGFAGERLLCSHLVSVADSVQSADGDIRKFGQLVGCWRPACQIVELQTWQATVRDVQADIRRHREAVTRIARALWETTELCYSDVCELWLKNNTPRK